MLGSLSYNLAILILNVTRADMGHSSHHNFYGLMVFSLPTKLVPSSEGNIKIFNLNNLEIVFFRE